jgi:hypothetical protein
MIGIPTCEEVTDLLTDLDEGALGPLAWTGVRVHLGLCPPCRAFLASLRRTPLLLRSLLGEEPGPEAAAERALSGALGALRQGHLPQGPQLHPDATDWAALGPQGDPLAALLLRVHLGWCGACRAQRPAEADAALDPGGGPLPEALRALLPPETQWRWARRGLAGGQAARVLKDPISGASLHLVRLPGGRTFPAHRHLGTETTVLLAGGLQDGAAHLHSGDWIAHRPNTFHAPTADPGDACWALVRLEGRLRFTGWRRFLV